MHKTSLGTTLLIYTSVMDYIKLQCLIGFFVIIRQSFTFRVYNFNGKLLKVQMYKGGLSEARDLVLNE